MNSARLFTLAWRVLPHLPHVCTRALFDVVGRLVHALRLPVVGQLETNLARIRPDLDHRSLRRISRAGMRSYLRYFGEVFTLRAVRPDQISARVRTVNDHVARQYFDAGQTVVAALGHTGNWDLAGAWCGTNLARVLTVAEVLEPAELFEEFLEFRADLGMDVIGLTKDGAVLPTLVERSADHTYLVPLLADRDLSRSSIEVQVGGHSMRVAAGPAALALAIDAPLVQIFIRHERLRGARRRAAGSPWGIVVEFTQIDVPEHLPESDRVAAMTQAWVDVLMAGVRSYPNQWHMLSKVFTADLDTARLARAHAREAGAQAPAEAAGAGEPEAVIPDDGSPRGEDGPDEAGQR